MSKVKNKLFIILLVILAILPVISLFHSGLPITHDGQDHVARIANFYQNLLDGNIIPRWAPNLNWGYGHPILEFLYPLPSYVASSFYFLGFSLVDSTKIVFGLGMFLSLIFMYLWLSSFLKKTPALLGAVLYTYAPYRFVDIYVRGDIGENLAFAFVPLTLFFMYKLYKTQNFKYSIFGSISLAFLILSHNAISLMIMPFIILYAFYFIWQSKFNKYFMLKVLCLMLLGFGLSAFFWIPGLLEGKYTLRNIVTKGGYVGRFADFKALIYGPWNYGQTGQFTQQLGIFQWLGLVLSPVVLFISLKKKDKNYILVLTLLIYTLIGIFLMLSVSSFIWSKIILLQNFQFPWRFLAITVFTTSVLGAIASDQIPRRYKTWSLVILIILTVVLSKDYMKPRGYLYKPENFYTGVYKGTTDTGESAPIWSVRFMEKIPAANLQIVDGYASIENLKRTSTYHKYHVNVSKKTIFRENTLYFPGWEIRANGVPVSIQFHTPHYNGVMMFTLDKGDYTVETVYKETKLRAIADAISVAVLFNILGFSIFKFVKVKF
ncbi:YfhO family protein [Patescibacteria group bacterium]|nr:YfhO family protein [Patescibacteria group bacterium]